MDIFVARQPIFNEKKQVVAYEILYRSGHKNVYDMNLDGDVATATVVTDTLINFGLNTLTGGKPAFINFTHRLLMEDLPTLFSPAQLTVEVLETVEVDDALVEKCKSLKENGYVIALDDYVGDPQYDRLMPYVDIIKVDFLILKSEGRKFVADRYKGQNKVLLAEKVESEKDFKEAVYFGYSLFQGFFFEKPVVCQTKSMAGSAFRYLDILKETIDENVAFNRITEIVKSDVSLTYKLLRMINSPAFDVVSEVTSVNHALALLGLKEIRKWATLIMLREMNTDKPNEIMRVSLARGIFAEKISRHLGIEDRHTEAFLIGLLSLVDAIMEMPLFDILEQLPLKSDLKEALLGASNPFHDILRLLAYYEKGNWDMVIKLCDEKGMAYELVNTLYLEAIRDSIKLIA